QRRFSPGERYGAVYQINYLRCILCGLCVEACPTRALTMTNEYEIADDIREPLIWPKEQLLAPLLPGMEPPPHDMRLGETERDYYGLRPAGVPAGPPPASGPEGEAGERVWALAAAGFSEAGEPLAGSPESGSSEAGSAESGSPDAGSPDAQSTENGAQQ